MARKTELSGWHRYKYVLSGLILILPGWFFYQSLHPQFPAPLPAQQAGGYSVSPMPFDLDPPYQHDGIYVKDFLLLFPAGDVSSIRQAYLSIGPQPLPLTAFADGEAGVLHGSRHGQHVHALAPAQIGSDDRLWLVIEDWQGRQHQISWEVPADLRG